MVGYYIVQTLIITGIFPFIEIAMAWTLLAVARRYDRGSGADNYTTKKTSIALYGELYSGPEYIIHAKYSMILNIAFCTMVYGIGVPLLFPIAAFAMWIMYSVERLTIAYFY